MKCLNMKRADVLFFLSNLILFFSENVRPNVIPTSQSATSGDEVLESKLNKDCPHILKIIHLNNITDYTINCKHTQIDIATVENVLQQACFVVKSMLSYMCEKQTNVSTNLFFRGNETSICPFDFSHLKQIGLKLNNYKLVKELTTKEHCSKICEDLYSYKNQCVVLNQLNNYLRKVIPPVVNENVTAVTRKKITPELVHTKTKTGNIRVSTSQEKDGQTLKVEVKDAINKETNETSFQLDKSSKKSVTKNMKEQKTEVTSTTKAESIVKDDINVSENKNYVPDEDEFKPELEDPNEDLESSIGQVNDVLPERSNLGQEEKVSDSTLKGKEIYPGEGFFQAEDSHFFFYFIMVSSIIVVSYLAFHNKNKILAYALEGSSGRRNRRRPNPARYRKLETNLEEAISSCATNSAASSVVY